MKTWKRTLSKCGSFVQLWLRDGKPKGLFRRVAKEGRVDRQAGRAEVWERAVTDECRAEREEEDLHWRVGGSDEATPK